MSIQTTVSNNQPDRTPAEKEATCPSWNVDPGVVVNKRSMKKVQNAEIFSPEGDSVSFTYSLTATGNQTHKKQAEIQG